MYKSLFLVACAVAAIVRAPAQAGQLSLTSTGQNAAWINLDNSNLTSINDDDPITTLAAVGPNVLNAVPTTFAQPENNFGGPPPIAGQSFLATKSGRVANIQLLLSGPDTGITYNVHLYDVGAGAPAPTGGTSYTNALPDLLPADSWVRFPGSAGAVFLLGLNSNGIPVDIISGHTYIFELEGLARDANGVLTGNPTGNNQLTWNRNAGANDYQPNGQAFRFRSALNGNPARAFAMAAHLVPEPATFVLFGLGLVGVVASRRRGC